VNTILYTLATAGHIDHGKSALVRALTGIEPDRLPEEKARGLTIELGFAHFTLPSPQAAAPDEITFDIGIIDVPGHEDFVKNMVAGVGSIDAALLVVAADDGWMPQTEEHLQILMHLGISRGVVALTKSDLIENVAAAIDSLRDRLTGTFLESAPIVPTSAINGRGIVELISALANVLAAAPPQCDIGKPRLAVDRAFSLKGIGTVVTGTLTGGMLATDQQVVIQPSSTRCRIRTIHTHGRQVGAGRPGSRVALNLPDLAVATARGNRIAGDVARGDVVTIAGLGDASRAIEVMLIFTERGKIPPMRSGANIWLHHGSGATAARLRLLRSSGGGKTLARLKLTSPLFALAGDRFVLRDWSERHTLTGGIILDVDPKPLRRDRRQLAFLETRAANPADVSVHLISQLVRDRAVERSGLLVRSRFPANEIDRALDRAIHDGVATSRGTMVYHAEAWAELCTAATNAIVAYHRSHPERAGLPLTDLHRNLEKPGWPAASADAVIEFLCQDGYVRRGPAIARIDHHPSLPPRLSAAGQKIRTALREHPFDPPSRNQLIRDDASAQALKVLIAAGEAVEIGPDAVLSADAYSRAMEIVKTHIREHGPATVSQLKTLLSSSRRVMVPLAEKLDLDGITRREGDLRVLRDS
jgi:selenocysteine-specific elongation factor